MVRVTVKVDIIYGRSIGVLARLDPASPAKFFHGLDGRLDHFSRPSQPSPAG